MATVRPCFALTTAVGLLAALCGCFAHPVPEEQTTLAEAGRELSANAATGTDISAHTRQLLRIFALDELWRSNPEAVPGRIVAVEYSWARWRRFGAVAELHYELGDRATDPVVAEPHFLDAALAARSALDALQDAPSAFDPRQRMLADVYAAALGRFLDLGQELHGHPSEWRTVRTTTGERPFRLAEGEHLLAAHEFDTFLVAEELRFGGRLKNRFRAFGVGTPLVAVGAPQPNAAEHAAQRMPALRTASATALLESGEDGVVELFLVDVFRTRVVTGRHGDVPLAADYSAAFGHLVAKLENPIGEETAGLLDPVAVEADRGLYLLQPYDPSRIPVLLVHGLWSSPVTWIEHVNSIWGDPELRSRYQVWLYMYPTGLSLTVNIVGIRDALQRVCSELDPDGDDHAVRDIVVVGHSMGGILTKALVSRSGQQLWDAIATRPFADVDADDEDREMIRSMVFFDPLPFIGRVVFLCTPHRGSSSADGVAGSIGAWLISLPGGIVERATGLFDANPGLFRSQFDHPRTSVDDLAETSPLLQALADLPIREGLPFHSIMGDTTGLGPPEANDGFVAYRSAHLDGARSELVIPGPHAVHQSPQAVMEVRRILLEHAGIDASANDDGQ